MAACCCPVPRNQLTISVTDCSISNALNHCDGVSHASELLSDNCVLTSPQVAVKWCAPVCCWTGGGGLDFQVSRTQVRWDVDTVATVAAMCQLKQITVYSLSCKGRCQKSELSWLVCHQNVYWKTARSVAVAHCGHVKQNCWKLQQLLPILLSCWLWNSLACAVAGRRKCCWRSAALYQTIPAHPGF